MPRIPDDLMHSIAYLYPTRESAESGVGPGATGFFVNYRASLEGSSYWYLITNSHVVENGCRYVRLVASDEVLDIPWALWEHHAEFDVVATPILTKPKGIIPLEWTTITSNVMDLRRVNHGVGDEVFMLSHFISQDEEKNQLLARFGNIAMMPGEPVLDGRKRLVKAYLVEMRSINGHSGSPVFVYIAPNSFRDNSTNFSDEWGFAFIGINTGHTIAISPVIDKTTGKPVSDKTTNKEEDWIVSQNTSISIVAPLWQIGEVLRSKALKQQREDAEQNQKKKG